MLKRHCVFSSAAVGLALLLAMPLMAASSGYMKIGDIKGESTDRAHSGEIEILSWSWGESHESQSAMTASKRQHKPMTITKQVDRASPLLQKANADGKVFPDVTLYLPKQGSEQEGYFKYVMRDVIITSYSVSGIHDDATVPMESISLSYSKMSTSFEPASSTIKQAKAKKAAIRQVEERQ